MTGSAQSRRRKGAALVSAGLSLLACAAPCLAQTSPAERDFVVSGSATRLCTVGSPVVQSAGANNLGLVNGQTVSIEQLAADDLSTRATSFEVVFAAMCNSPHRLELTSDNGGLWVSDPGSVVGSFGTAVPYRADISWGDLNAALDVQAHSLGPQTRVTTAEGPNAGDLLLAFTIQEGATNAGAGVPLVAGPYRDVVRLVLGVQ